MPDSHPLPFSPPLARAMAQVDSLRAVACVDACSLLGRLATRAVPGRGLVRTAPDAGLAVEGRTLVVARAWLRVEVRGDVATVVALQPEAEPLLQRLGERLPGAAVAAAVLRAPVLAEQASPGLDDDRVLRLPSV